MSKNGEMFRLKLSEEILVSLSVLGGYYGAGQERIDGLRSDGYDPDQIQKCVNDLYRVFEKWGVKFGN